MSGQARLTLPRHRTREGALTPWGFGLGFDYEARGPRPVSVGLSEYDFVGRIETEQTNWVLLQAEIESLGSPVGRLLLEEDAAAGLLRVREVAWYPPDASAGDIEVQVESWLIEQQTGAVSVIPGSAVRVRLVEEPAIESTGPYELVYDVLVFDTDGALDETVYEIVTEPGTVVYDERVVGTYGIEPTEGVTELGAVAETEPTAVDEGVSTETGPSPAEPTLQPTPLTVADIVETLRRQESYLADGGVWVYTVKSTEPGVLPESFDDKLFRDGVAALTSEPSYKELGIVPDDPESGAELSVESYVVLDDDGENRITLLCPEQFYLLDAEGRECHEFVRYAVAYSGELLRQEIVRWTFVPGEGAQEVVITETPGGESTALVRLGDISYDVLTPEGALTPWGFGLSFDYKALGPRPMSVGLAEWELSLEGGGESYKSGSDGSALPALTLKAERWAAAPSVPCVGFVAVSEEQGLDDTVLYPFNLAWRTAGSVADDILEVAVTSWLDSEYLPLGAVIPETAQRVGTRATSANRSSTSYVYSYEIISFTQPTSTETTVYASMFETPADPTTAVHDERGPGLYEVVEPVAARLSNNRSKASGIGILSGGISVNLTVYHGGPDLDQGETDNSDSSGMTEVSEYDEDDPCGPGACLLVNRDDDDGKYGPDMEQEDDPETEETNEADVDDEDNLAMITLELIGWTPEDEGELSLSLGSGLTAWENKSKVKQVTDLSWDLGDTDPCDPKPPDEWPSTLWIQASSTGVKYITLLYTPEVGESTGDGVKLTVLNICVNSADVTQDNINITLTGTSVSGTMKLELRDPTNDTIREVPSRSAGTYPESFDLPNLTFGEYTIVRATWTINNIGFYHDYGYHIFNFGEQEMTRYNTPDESHATCQTETPRNACTSNGPPECNIEEETFEMPFEQRANTNGNGRTTEHEQVNGLVQKEAMCDPEIAEAGCPRGYAWRQVAQINGSCGTPVGNGTVARRYNNNDLGCGDQVYIVEQDATKTVNDKGNWDITETKTKYALDNYTTSTGQCSKITSLPRSIYVKTGPWD